MRLLIILLVLLVSTQAHAATKYVATTGSDSTGDGSSGNPWATPQKCVGNVGPGDTCTVADGTYTDTDGNGIVLYIASGTGAIDGTAGNPVTIKSTNPHGAKLRVPSAVSANAYGVRVTRPYYIIEGFEITDDDIPTTQGSTFGSIGVSFGESAGPTGVIVRRNDIHNIAHAVCSNSAIGNAGIGGRPGSGGTIEYNKIRNIGRLRNGESSCSTTIFQNDHGIYIWNISSLTIHHNEFYGNKIGYDLHVYAASQSSSGIYFYNNTVSKPTLTGSAPTACMLLSYTNSDIQFKNNIFYNCPSGYALTWFAAAIQTNVVLSYNLSDSSDADLNNPSSKPSSGITTSNNTVGSSTINFTAAGSDNYTLAASSAAIDAGTNVGYAYNGSAPTIGAYDPPRFASCTATAATTVALTFTNNLAAPMLPSSAATGITARKNSVSNTVNSTSKAGDNVITLATASSYGGADTVDITASSTNVTDSLLIGGLTNQPFITPLTNQSCTNSVSGVSYTLTQSRYELHSAISSEASPIILPHGYASTGAAENFTGYTVVAGGKIRLRFALVCGGADCASQGYLLYYALNGGTYTVVSNEYDADNVAMCGTIAGNPSHGSATTNQLSTAGTFTPGGFMSSGSSVPTVTGLANTYKTEMEYCVKFDTDATGFYDFRMRTASGLVLDTYTVTPRLTIVPYAVGW